MSERERRKSFETSSGLKIKPSYDHHDWNAEERESTDLGRPGEFPFTRGVQPSMYRGRLWTMRQYAGFGSARESNERYHQLLRKGQTGLSVAFDLPTQMGFDSDHVMASGEVGKVGVAISSVEDMDLLLKDLPLDKISTSMTINSTASILLAFYIAVAKKRGVQPAQLNGTIQNDLLKEYIARGTYIYPPSPSLRIITDIFEYCSKHVPQWNTISISGYHIREAGSTAVQEVAFTLANAITYVDAALAKGMRFDTFAGRLSFFFNVHNNFLEEVAKFRAARRMWAKIARERFDSKDEKAQKLRFHSQTAGSALTAQQPENNIVRVTMQALASVFGGTQSLHTNSMDEALGLPTEKAATIALRTQQIIAQETGAADVIDPFAGSFYVESLTNKIEEAAMEYLKRIEDLGGVVRCIETGFIQNEIQTAAYKYQVEVDSKDRIIVGVNDYTEEAGSTRNEVLKISHEIEKEQVHRLKNFKSRRDQTLVKSSLEKLINVARSNDNLMPVTVEAVENHVTLGEIADAFRSVFGKFKERITL